jgi:uroporphyrinogen decarboxylase
MNAAERVQARLNGQPVDRAPNFDILMARAAHHIGQPLSRYYLDYRVLAEANLAVWQNFHLDLLQTISDPYREASDLGLAVEFPADSLPVSTQPLLADPAGLGRLRLVEPTHGRRMHDRLEAVRFLREQAAGQVPVMGWVEGALAEAADLRGVSQIMTDLYERPEWVAELLEFCVNQEIAFARAQVEAGADLIGLGDAVCSQISPKMYRQFGLPYEQRIFAAVREMGATPRLHICGNTSRILADMTASGAAIIDLDWMVDFAQASRLYGAQVSLCGNVDPVAVMLQGSPESIEKATRACLEAGGPRCFSAAGCEIPDATPSENLLAHHRALV